MRFGEGFDFKERIPRGGARVGVKTDDCETKRHLELSRSRGTFKARWQRVRLLTDIRYRLLRTYLCVARKKESQVFNVK